MTNLSRIRNASLKGLLQATAIDLERALEINSPYRTGALRNSIEVTTIGQALHIDMFSYGVRLNEYYPKYKGWIGLSIDQGLDKIEERVGKEVANAIKIIL